MIQSGGRGAVHGLAVSLLVLGAAYAEDKKPGPEAGRKVLLVCAEPAAMPRTGKAADGSAAALKTREDLLHGFQAARLDAAFLDADFAAWYLHAHPDLKLRLVADFVPRERWNLAVAVRAKDAPLLVEINRALSQLAESGELK